MLTGGNGKRKELMRKSPLTASGSNLNTVSKVHDALIIPVLSKGNMSPQRQINGSN